VTETSLRLLEAEKSLKTMITIANDISNDPMHSEGERRGARMVSVSQRAYLKKIRFSE
jgi:hypothetical protein